MDSKIKAIQAKLKEEKLDGWLFYIFRETNPVAESVLELPVGQHRSRRCYYWIGAEGNPVKLMHRIEPHTIENLPGETRFYLSYQSLREELSNIVNGVNRIAMEYSPDCMIPTVSWVDGGTIDFIRSLGVNVESSAELIQYFEATLDDDQIDSHLKAAILLRDIVKQAHNLIGNQLKYGEKVTEYQIQQFIMQRFADEGLETDHGPIVAVNAHASDPHYEPVATREDFIQAGDMLLIDLWARFKNDTAIYADETWMAYIGNDPVPQKMQEVWEVVRNARQAGYHFVKERYAKGEDVYGWEVDDATREVVEKAGYGEYFFHRTGHSIGLVTHGNGANIDNLETKELRRLIPRTLFSIEPGVYLPEFGVRSEFDVLIDADGVVRIAEGTDQMELARITW